MSFFRNNDNNNVNTRFRRFHKPKASQQKKQATYLGCLFPLLIHKTK